MTEEQREHRAAYYKRPEIRARERKRLHDDPRISLVYHAKYRAKRLGLDFDLTPEDIVVPSTCPLLLIPIFISPNGKPCANSPTLDRVNNDRGYTKDNVKVISHKANSMKREHTVESLERFIQYVKGDI